MLGKFRGWFFEKIDNYVDNLKEQEYDEYSYSPETGTTINEPVEVPKAVREAERRKELDEYLREQPVLLANEILDRMDMQDAQLLEIRREAMMASRVSELNYITIQGIIRALGLVEEEE